MALGLDQLEWDRGRWLIRGDLLVNISANSDVVVPGPSEAGWQRLYGFHPVAVCVEGTFLATVTVYVSQAKNPRGDGPGTNYPFIGTPVVDGPQALEIDRPYNWIKAVVSNWTSGTIRRVSLFGAQTQ